MTGSPEIQLVAPSPGPISDALAKEEAESYEASSSADEATEMAHKLEMYKLEADRRLGLQQIELERERAHVEGLKQDIEARKNYSNKIFRLVSVWLVAVFVIIMVSAFCGKLSDRVIVVLISGTTVNVLGLFLVVANYLFPKNGKPMASPPKS